MNRFAYWVLALACALTTSIQSAENAAAVEARLIGDVQFLADDKLEGRGPETQGLVKASEFIRDQFQTLGLKGGAPDGGYFQEFTIGLGATLDAKKTSLTLTSPAGKKLQLTVGKDYHPLASGGSGAFQAPIVFVGYGITAKEYQYDDYAGVDVAGKVVLMIRREPQQGNDKSKFSGKQTTKYAAIIDKVETAFQRKAAGVLLVTDPFSAPDASKDKLSPVDYLGNTQPLGIPIAHITQAVADQLLAGTPLGDLRTVEKAIDGDLKPRSQLLEGTNADGDFAFHRRDAKLRNVVGVAEGEGPHAHQTIVIGAHYDHLGYGGNGSLAPNSKDVHNGADDNASGTAAMIELARRFAQRTPRPARRIVFIAFSAEERGLLGSTHYVKKAPLFPLADTIAMLNYDMVGRLNKDRLILYGTKTAKEFEKLIERSNQSTKFKIQSISGGNGPSDHAVFFGAKIPVLHFFTGTHKDYHRPSDDTDKINVVGIRRVVEFSETMIDALLAPDKRPEFVQVASNDPHAGLDLPPSNNPGGKSAFLGTVPDYGEEVDGVLLNDVREGSPAHNGGLKAGDIIVEFATMPIRNARGLSLALRKHKPGETVEIIVSRDKKKIPLTVTLGSR